jgi:5'-nucleotidase/2',3'-cyclic phosphodiesterase and related esterases
MHAKIQEFPKLAAAVQACRDTTRLVMLVDAGDRWTGNAYVDRAETPGMPMIALMNRLGYDVATLGNHEFDFGQAFLARMIDSMDFEVICANVVSDTCTFPQLPSSVICVQKGLRVGFVGVVTNYEGPGHPAGNKENFEGLEFPDPQLMAIKYGEELRAKCDVLVLVSHMGDNRDIELLEKGPSPYDVVIGGHTHELVDTLIGGTQLTQTGKYLANVGVTTIRMKGKKVVDIDYRNVPLADYDPEPEYQEQVDFYYADPELNKTVGMFATTVDKWGLANWMSRSIADELDAEVGFYHIGGVRLDSIQAGNVSKAIVYSLEPFRTKAARMKMTPADMRRMIIAKFNDKMNTKEGHRVDMISTTPYVILTDQTKDAVDVQFPRLREGRTYKVAVTDYIYNNYKELNYTDGEVSDEKVEDILLDELEEDSPLKADNTQQQLIRSK